MKIKEIILIVGLVLISANTYAQTKVFTRTSYSTFEQIELFSDSSYVYKCVCYFDVGKSNDSIMNRGKWSSFNDTIVLNSYNIPDNKNKQKVIESFINDSIIEIKIGTKNKIPLGFILPKKVRINNKYYKIPFTNDSIVNIVLPPINVSFINFPGYPIYHVKNKDSNHFRFYLNDLDSSNLIYIDKTYFFNEQFILSSDTLYQINDVQSSKYFILSQ